MNRHLILFLFIFTSVFAQKEIENNFDFNLELSAECEPLTTIGNCVNIASGCFFQIDNDLVSNTIDPISLTRFYDSGSRTETFLGSKFGSQFPLYAMFRKIEGGKKKLAIVSERDGFHLPYLSNRSKTIYGVDPQVLKKGYTNLSRAEIGGQENFINRKAFFNGDKGKESLQLHLGNGSRRTYKNPVKLTDRSRRELGLLEYTVYLLDSETKANGNRLNFTYTFVEGKPYLSNIKTLNRPQTEVLNELTIKYADNSCTIRSSCGRESTYAHDTVSCTYFDYSSDKRILTNARSTQNPCVEYAITSPKILVPVINKVSRPNGNELYITYGVGGKVASLQKRFDSDSPFAPIYTLTYDKLKTNVWNALDQLTIYNFDDENRLKSIDYHENGSPIKKEIFAWSKIPWQKGWLESKSIQQNDITVAHKTYCYDVRGNVVRETIKGNLTGQSTDPVSSEEYSIEYKYTSDDRNLILEKKTPEGLIISYDYLPGTNLCTHEFHAYEGKIQERFFYNYDDNGQVSLSIHDNGSGLQESDLTDVTYRISKTITTSQERGKAFFGKPILIEESYLNRETGLQTILHKTEFEYDVNGNEVSVRKYNSQNILCYESSKQYDDRQRVSSETNSLGQVTCYAYDENNNNIREELVGSGKITLFKYDCANRMVLKTEIHPSATVTTGYSYNHLDQLVSETDRYGQITTYTYDRMGNKIRSSTGSAEKNTTYNVLNQAIAKTDENGYTTLYSYTLYGKPTAIHYPDGSEERYIYYPNGLLKQKVYPDSTSTKYIYDAGKHLISEQTLSQEGMVLSENRYCYNGDFLVAKRDAKGIYTEYHYDGAGRKIKEIVQGSRVINFKYDDFDRLITRSEGGKYEVYDYDQLDRLLVNTIEDEEHNVAARKSYSYDLSGNIIQESIWCSDDKIAHYRSKYNSDGTIAWKENPLGERTYYEYNYNHRNSCGELVQFRTIKDPSGRIHIEIDDVFGRCIEKSLVANGITIEKTHFEYDPAGKLIKRVAVVMDEGKPLREFAVEYAYNSRGLLTKESEVSSAKTTTFTYDRKSRLIKRTKPDSNYIFYVYDDLDQLIHKKSSDNTVDYEYVYDIQGNLIKISDRIYQTVQKRTYDNTNRLIQEEISPGVVLNYFYDTMDRLNKLTMPDQSYITYNYDPFHLKRINRYDYEGKEKYYYELSYDMKGHILKGSTMASQISYEYDLLERVIKTQAPSWESNLTKFDPSGNLLESTQKDPSGIWDQRFTYDGFHHLQSENIIPNFFTYDSLGNCLKRNEKDRQIDISNQLIDDGNSQYHFDVNGNLVKQDTPEIQFLYDALNRLVSCKNQDEETIFEYDAFGRCIKIANSEGSRQLFYFHDQEIGALLNNELVELRLTHPDSNYEKTFSIELKENVYFPVQNSRNDICALQTKGGELADWYNYSTFGTKIVPSHLENSTNNPWQFANRREVAGLSMFTHRFYNPSLMRWQTMDPLTYEDGLNAYTYAHNNPMVYKDPDGRYAIPIIIVSLEAIGVSVSLPSFTTVCTFIAAAATSYAILQTDHLYDEKYCSSIINSEIDGELPKKGKKKSEVNSEKPPYNGEILGDDPSKCPGPGFKWKGEGKPGEKAGSWHNSETRESLYPDLKHPSPKKPHWDYKNQEYEARLNTDGTWEFK